MTPAESERFINAVGRSELFDELRQIEEDTAWSEHAQTWGARKSRYLKAVRASLVALGYDEQWVNGEFRTLLEARYLSRSVS